MAGDWMDDAACREIGNDIFFVDYADVYAREEAKKVCHRCPVTFQCLEYAVNAPFKVSGIWGGVYFTSETGGRRRKRDA